MQAPRHVLVVDDERDVQALVRLVLERQGYDVDAASDGREALAKIEARRPDLVLLDLMMPVMNGWQFRAKQLQDPALAEIPVIVMSASDDEDVPAVARCVVDTRALYHGERKLGLGSSAAATGSCARTSTSARSSAMAPG